MIVYEENHVKYQQCVTVNSCNLNLKAHVFLYHRVYIAELHEAALSRQCHRLRRRFVFYSEQFCASREITESDILSEQGSDIEGRFDRLLCDREIQERVRQSVPAARRYKDEWAVRAFETWRLNREKIARRD